MADKISANEKFLVRSGVPPTAENLLDQGSWRDWFCCSVLQAFPWCLGVKNYRANYEASKWGRILLILTLTPFFGQAKHRKSRSSVFRCPRTPRKRLFNVTRAITSLKTEIDEETKKNWGTTLSRNHHEFCFSDIFCYTLSSRGDKVLAVASMGPGNAVAKAANEMFEGKMRSASEIR